MPEDAIIDIRASVSFIYSVKAIPFLVRHVFMEPEIAVLGNNSNDAPFYVAILRFLAR